MLPVFKFIEHIGKPLADGVMSQIKRAFATGGAEASPILKRQASFMNPFTTTATFTNLGEQTCTATSRTNATIRYKKSQIGC